MPWTVIAIIAGVVVFLAGFLAFFCIGIHDLINNVCYYDRRRQAKEQKYGNRGDES